jgi:hypothetical protein
VRADGYHVGDNAAYGNAIAAAKGIVVITQISLLSKDYHLSNLYFIISNSAIQGPNIMSALA